MTVLTLDYFIQQFGTVDKYPDDWKPQEEEIEPALTQKEKFEGCKGVYKIMLQKGDNYYFRRFKREMTVKTTGWSSSNNLFKVITIGYYSNNKNKCRCCGLEGVYNL